jgi:uncharacterized membrane protein
MKPDAPITLSVATYATRDPALADFKAALEAMGGGSLDHTAAAVLTKDANGHLEVERHNTTTKHLALVGAALIVIAPPAGIAAIAGGAGVGALVGHFWHNIPKHQVNDAAELLQAGESGLVVVTVNRQGTDITSLLAHAGQSSSAETKAANLDAELEKELANTRSG